MTLRPGTPQLLAAALVVLAAMPAHAQTRRQTSATAEPFRTLAALDASVFDAYNRCDLEAFSRYFAEDLEFYHDRAGVSRTREAILDGLKRNICGKVRRELVEGTLEVHPLDGYGAMQMGVHRFFRTDGTAEPPGEARFLHVWHQANGAWVITRVFSYDHHEAAR